MGYALPRASNTVAVANQFDRAALRDIIARRSFGRGDFVLASGAHSDFYFDLKPTMLDPEGAYLSARAFLWALGDEECDYVGGLEMGAVPILAAMAAVSFELGCPTATLFVRKEVKGHGTKKLIEGLHPGESLVGKKIVVADDVTTSGKSVLQAVDAFRAAGATVTAAITLVDRDATAKALLSQHDIALTPIFTASDFL